MTWLTTTARVRPVIAPTTSAATASASSSGDRISAVVTRAPAGPQAAAQAFRTAPYSWEVSNTSSPGAKFKLRATAFMPVVEFATGTTPPASHPTNRASTSVAASSSSSSRRTK